MKKELDERLVKDFPNLYVDRYGDMRRTAMCWGFPGDGWFDLIYKLSSKLEALIVKHKKEHPEDEYPPRAVQVKEKFGGLRFYMNSETEEMLELIGEAEIKSKYTCETCGVEAKIVSYCGWRCCACTDCLYDFFVEDMVREIEWTYKQIIEWSEKNGNEQSTGKEQKQS